MKRITSIILFICALSGSVRSQDIDSLFDSVMKKHNLIGLSVAFVKDNKIIYNKGFGLANIEKSINVDDSTRFRIASVSKCITALSLMTLYDKGLFRLDDDIGNLLGYRVRNPYFPDQPITVRMVLKHTSSITDGSGYSKFVGTLKKYPCPPRLSGLLCDSGKYYSSDLWLKAKPGTRFQYSNLNYGIIATLVEKLSGQSFDVYVKNTLFNPLQLDADYNILNFKDYNKVAVLYRKEGKVVVPQADNFSNKSPDSNYIRIINPGENAVVFAPAGGLRISSHDMAVLMLLLMNNGSAGSLRLLSDTTVALMKDVTQQDLSIKKYGFGIEPKTMIVTVDDIPLKIKVIGHGGAAYGFIGDMFWNEENKFGFVIFANGCRTTYHHHKGTSFYMFEEDILEILYNHFVLNPN
jgi:CubicO group peptidase (beta-lactamase class C family)